MRGRDGRNKMKGMRCDERDGMKGMGGQRWGKERRESR
jgi:hypothetical protein